MFKNGKLFHYLWVYWQLTYLYTQNSWKSKAAPKESQRKNLYVVVVQ